MANATNIETILTNAIVEALKAQDADGVRDAIGKALEGKAPLGEATIANVISAIKRANNAAFGGPEAKESVRKGAESRMVRLLKAGPYIVPAKRLAVEAMGDKTKWLDNRSGKMTNASRIADVAIKELARPDATITSIDEAVKHALSMARRLSKSEVDVLEAHEALAAVAHLKPDVVKALGLSEAALKALSKLQGLLTPAQPKAQKEAA